MTAPPANPRPPWPDIFIPAFAAAAALAYLWFGWCVFPLSSWNEVRLAPTFALRDGLDVYPPATGGPLGTWIYGPLPLLLNLPATLATSAKGALLIASAINLLTLLLPLALLCLFVPRWPARIAALAVCVLLLPPRHLAFQVADHTAVAFGLASCWLLARPASLGRPHLVAAAACAVLAACAKQIAVLLPIAHALYLLRSGRRDLLRTYATWTALLGALAAFATIAWFGWSGLWLNLVRIPALLPWADPLEKIASRWPQLLASVVLPLALLVLAFRSRRWRPDASTPSGRLVLCGTASFLVLLPLGLASFFKIGGDINTLHSPAYLIPAVVVALFAHAGTLGGPSLLRLLPVVVAAIALRLPELASPLPGPLTRPLTEARLLAEAAPGRTWFPNHPLATYYTDHRLYHVEDGIATRHLAGLGLDEKTFRQHLPPLLETVICDAEHDRPLSLGLLRDFDQVVRLERWTLHRRPDDTPR